MIERNTDYELKQQEIQDIRRYIESCRDDIKRLEDQLDDKHGELEELLQDLRKLGADEDGW